ncbi:MAG: hypothetical protein AAF335_01735 [Bacteroidota bacterium]
MNRKDHLLPSLIRKAKVYLLFFSFCAFSTTPTSATSLWKSTLRTISTATLCLLSSMPGNHVQGNAWFTSIPNGVGYDVFIGKNQTILVGGEIDDKITVLRFDNTLELSLIERKVVNEGSFDINLQGMAFNGENSIGFFGNESVTDYHVFGTIDLTNDAASLATKFEYDFGDAEVKLYDLTYLPGFDSYMMIGETVEDNRAIPFISNEDHSGFTVGASAKGTFQWGKQILASSPFLYDVRLDAVATRNATFGISIGMITPGGTSRDLQYLFINTLTADSESINYAWFELFNIAQQLSDLKIYDAIYTTQENIVFTGSLTDQDFFVSEHLFIASISFSRNIDIKDVGEEQEKLWGWYMEEQSAGFSLNEDLKNDIVSVGYYGPSKISDLVVVKNGKDGSYKWHFSHQLGESERDRAHAVAFNDNNDVIIVGTHQGIDRSTTSLFVLKVSSNGKKCGDNRNLKFIEFSIYKRAQILKFIIGTALPDVEDADDFSVRTSELEVTFEVCENHNVNQDSINMPTWLLGIAISLLNAFRQAYLMCTS